MTKTADHEARIEALVTKLAPSINAGFLASLDRIRTRIKRRDLAELIAAGNVYAAAQLIDAAVAAEPFRPFEAAVSDALLAAGRSTAETIVAAVVRKRAPWAFQPFNPTTAAAAKSWIGRTVDYLTGTLRAAALAVMLGQTPGRKAVDVAQEVLNSLGLTERQVKGAQALRAAMERDRQEQIAEAMRSGQPERVRREAEAKGKTPEQVEAIVARYIKRAARERGKFLASDQARRAVSIATQRAWEQAAEDGLIDPELTTKVWVNRHDGRVRTTHVAIPEIQPEGVPLFARFQTGDGRLILMPHDPDADQDLTANCRCIPIYRAKVLS